MKKLLFIIALVIVAITANPKLAFANEPVCTAWGGAEPMHWADAEGNPRVCWVQRRTCIYNNSVVWTETLVVSGPCED